MSEQQCEQLVSSSYKSNGSQVTNLSLLWKDWNADPANCLTAAGWLRTAFQNFEPSKFHKFSGHSAVAVEGDRKFLAVLVLQNTMLASNSWVRVEYIFEYAGCLFLDAVIVPDTRYKEN